ncbi:MAG TPA: hypothetical protein PLH43_04635 [Acetivibrio sp.]|uniref:cyclic-phosphate processing receiver domain-containing protein n=1 Tax=Acetivibrio sp. TaxID=1872092 RepID=UPI002BFE79D9|nr:cyclic-phosphate processing receiver domain-containing protein [Acetivibrio sp.]HOM02098.1 hypothetical protein [Acetivibrio sp.]
MKIILDDKRELPSKGYNCVRTYEDCIVLLDVFKEICFICLDYHLEGNTGYDVLVYVRENGIQPKHINFHSDDKACRSKMVDYAKKHFPSAFITENSKVK